MRFKMDDRKYDVTFRYVDVVSKNSGTPVRETHCIISEYYPDETDRDKRFVEISKGVAVQNPKDAFVRAVGRRKSLTKALAAGKATKEQRTYIWDMYFHNHGDFWDGCSDKRVFDAITNFSDLVNSKEAVYIDAR